MFRFKHLFILVFQSPLFLILVVPLLIASVFAAFKGPDMLVTDWTRSYDLHKQPHAIWLFEDEKVGANLGALQRVLLMAQRRRQRPELVIYTIPLRDLGQSSEGGFKTYEDYIADNTLIAGQVENFIQRGGLPPRIYIEPDALGHAIQYRRDTKDSLKALDLYEKRVNAHAQLVKLYSKVGALVYLDAAHSGWFDYEDKDIQAMANILNASGVHQAYGITTNISNRQPLETEAQNEVKYLQRLLPRLQNKKLDVIVDTSRNGGITYPRKFYLSPDGRLVDNEFPQGRLVGAWQEDETGEVWFRPFFGLPLPLSELVNKDKHQFSKEKQVLYAPHWLDAVGDVQVGLPPTDKPGVPYINRFRYIKPPDDCDGGLNCPPGGLSKHDLWTQTEQLQIPDYLTDKTYWDNK